MSTTPDQALQGLTSAKPLRDPSLGIAPDWKPPYGDSPRQSSVTPPPATADARPSKPSPRSEFPSGFKEGMTPEDFDRLSVEDAERAGDPSAVAAIRAKLSPLLDLIMPKPSKP